MKRRRCQLSLWQHEVALRLGVHESTIINWETGLCSASVRMIPRIIGFLGYCPYEPPKTLGEKLVDTRRRLGLSRRKLADQLGIYPGTLTAWEEGMRVPRGKWLEIVHRFLSR